MARGSTPIVVQGTSEPDLNCISERLIREQGRLKTRREQATGAPDEERIAKVSCRLEAYECRIAHMVLKVGQKYSNSLT